MISCNNQYLQAVVQYLSVLEEEQLEVEEWNGKETYLFRCPFCSHYSSTKRSKQNKTGRLVRAGSYSWIYTCSRGYSNECRGGARSFHSFLAMLHRGLFYEYQQCLS